MSVIWEYSLGCRHDGEGLRITQVREEHGEWALAQYLDKTPVSGPRRGPRLMVCSPTLIRAIVFTTSIKNRESLPKHLKSLGVY